MYCRSIIMVQNYSYSSVTHRWFNTNHKTTTTTTNKCLYYQQVDARPTTSKATSHLLQYDVIIFIESIYKSLLFEPAGRQAAHLGWNIICFDRVNEELNLNFAECRRRTRVFSQGERYKLYFVFHNFIKMKSKIEVYD